MGRVQKRVKENDNKPMHRTMSPEARENQMISLAIDLAEQQLREGTASSQVITHYLKLGSTKEQQEKEKLEEEVKLLKAKTKALETADQTSQLYAEAIKAFKSYTGNEEDEDE